MPDVGSVIAGRHKREPRNRNAMSESIRRRKIVPTDAFVCFWNAGAAAVDQRARGPRPRPRYARGVRPRSAWNTR
jgi:hypothetical protein